MSLLPPGSECPGHPGTPASWTCPRCGRFICVACERRTRPEAAPMCPSCWELRSRTVQAQDAHPKTRLHNVGFGLGLASVLPLWPLILASLITNLIVLVKHDTDELRPHRWKAFVGLGVTVVSILGWVGLAVVAVGLK